MNEGLKLARLVMVLSSISPVFLLWGIRGAAGPYSPWLELCCLLMIVIPNAVLFLRIRAARARKDRRVLRTGRSEDHRSHLLVYLFALMLPFYAANLDSAREIVASLTAISLVVFIFWHLNLHYLNLLFAARGYRIFTVQPLEDGNRFSGNGVWVLITRRVALAEGTELNVYRISNTVYLEMDQ